jgi:hypothetical protein
VHDRRPPQPVQIRRFRLCMGEDIVVERHPISASTASR